MNTTPPEVATLRKLQFERSNVSPFKTHIEFRAWADRVEPLLSFDSKLQSKFASSAQLVELRTQMPDLEYDVRSVNECIGVLNQAVTKLEITRKEASPNLPECALEWPEKNFTLKWLFDHAPISFYGVLLTGLVASFSAGLWLGIKLTTIQSNPFSAYEPTNIKPTNANAEIINSNAASSVTQAPSPAKAE